MSDVYLRKSAGTPAPTGSPAPDHRSGENSPGDTLPAGRLFVRKLWRVLVAALWAALMFCGLVILWLGSASRQVAARGADALVIRAVLRGDVDNVAAENLAHRLRTSVPYIKIDVLTETMGRSLMALQEPWVAQMPDFDVTPLPILLEIHHPDLLAHPERVGQFVAQLQKEPEVDFVAYNEAAHNRLVSLTTSISDVATHSTGWLLTALCTAGFCAAFLAGMLRPAASLLRIATDGALSWVGASVLTWTGYRAWEAALTQPGAWQPLSIWMLLLLLAFSGGILMAGLFTTRIFPWRK